MSGPVRPASRQSGARSPRSRCWTMWNENSSSSPIAAIGDVTATTSRAIPSEKSAMRQPGTRLTTPRERPRADGVGDRDRRDRHELERVDRPARPERHRDHGVTVEPPARRSSVLGAAARIHSARGGRGRQTYAEAGVSLATGEAVVERLRAAVESTGATRVRRLRGTASAGRASGCSRRPRTRSARSSCSPGSGARSELAAPTWRRTASTT